MSMQNRLNAYRETHIKTASQGKIIIMLYDESLRQLDTAIHLLKDNTREYDKVNSAILRAQDMVTELMVSLDFEKGGDIAQGLYSLYMFFNQHMMQANMKKDADMLSTVRSQLNELRTAWDQVVNKAQNGGQNSGGVNVAG
ncbi:MAG: flagellar export chaperone FliS [Spirochaetaceae bacterium]|nr:flagellar export chaperone FliS [Spirochaetaceae bacterium]MCF7947546.1 flagellar export chaperone FliS [Spirochaetia bacterium]MCF7950470.1 flagellar export chaperone FliS [Spirochaetaceae bacterium]